MPAQPIKVTCPTCKREFEVDLDELRKQVTVYKMVYRGDKEEWRAPCPHCGHYAVVTIERGPGHGG